MQNCRCYRADTIFKVKVEWPWRYRSRSKVITCDTPSHASDHLYQIWKESIKNCRRYRADTITKVKVEWPWRYRSRSKVIICNTLGKFDWGVRYVIIFLYAQFWIRLGTVSYRGKKVRTVDSPAVRSVNKSRDTRNCVQNEPKYAICVLFAIRLYH